MIEPNDMGMKFQVDPHFIGMDRYIQFFGVVESRDDPLRLGRCKVRIIGLHSEDKSLLATDDLPWAYPILPLVNSPASLTTGYSPVGPTEGTYVVGFFADGMDRQVPMIYGSMTGGVGQFSYGNTDQTGITNIDPNSANAPSNLNGSLVKKGVDCARIFLNIARSNGMDYIKDYHAAGIMGNIAIETRFRAVFNGNYKTDSDIPPKVGQRLRPYNGASSAYGYAQWIGSRMDNFIKFCNDNNLDARSPAGNVGFILWELNNTYTSIRSAIKSGGYHRGPDKYSPGPWNLDDIRGFTAYFMSAYESPGQDGPKTLTQRQSNSEAILAAMNNTNVPPRGTAR